jgi:hypothetical protein
MAVVTGTAQLVAGFNQTNSTGLITTQTLPASISLTTQYTNGTGAGAINLIYAKQIALVASTPQTLDLTTLTDLSGATVSFARIRELVVQVVTTTAGFNVTLGNAAATSFAAFWGAAGTDTVFAGAIRYFTDPTSVGVGVGAVTSGTSKSLKLDPGSNNVTINLLIAGCTAVS